MNLGPTGSCNPMAQNVRLNKNSNPTVCCLEGIYLDSKNAKERDEKK